MPTARIFLVNKRIVDSHLVCLGAVYLPSKITAFVLLIVLISTPMSAATEKMLFSFSSPDTAGADPVGNLIRDAAGNLYGATNLGGPENVGTVFELSPNGSRWTQTVLYSFPNQTVGYAPSGGLVMDKSGNLYGVTQFGGLHGYGTVYRLTPDGQGNWTETILKNFQSTSSRDGSEPFGTLTLDPAGNVYGSTIFGGQLGKSCGQGCGVVFELSPKKSGSWKYKVLHRFGGFRRGDGQTPTGSLALDGTGNLFGTTITGGSKGWGMVFELSPGATGWSETILHNFQGAPVDGAQPPDGMVFDSSGNLYGLTTAGGVLNDNCPYGCGTVYELSPNGGGWTESVLYSFSGGSDGAFPGCLYKGCGTPYGAIVTLQDGNIYGTASFGGNAPAYSGDGVVFELSPSGDQWMEQVLHTFTSSPDGQLPLGGVVFDGNGNLYGTTVNGGKGTNDGIVYEVSP